MPLAKKPDCQLIYGLREFARILSSQAEVGKQKCNTAMVAGFQPRECERASTRATTMPPASVSISVAMAQFSRRFAGLSRDNTAGDEADNHHRRAEKAGTASASAVQR
jgi:hypothetical protein